MFRIAENRQMITEDTDGLHPPLNTALESLEACMAHVLSGAHRGRFIGRTLNFFSRLGEIVIDWTVGLTQIPALNNRGAVSHYLQRCDRPTFVSQNLRTE